MDRFPTQPKPALRSNLLLTIVFALIAVALTCQQQQVKAQGADPVVVLQTTKGPIAIRVYLSLVPNTASSFLDLVNRGFYNGLTFHRVENWVIQGGDPHANGSGVYVDPNTGQPRYIPLETNRMLRHNAAGVVAMAHSTSVNSNSCQFYITKKATPALDGSYSIFGGVVDGMNTVFNIQRGDQILSAQIVSGGPRRQRPQPGPSGPPPGGPSGDSGF